MIPGSTLDVCLGDFRLLEVVGFLQYHFFDLYGSQYSDSPNLSQIAPFVNAFLSISPHSIHPLPAVPTLQMVKWWSIRYIKFNA